MAKWHRVEEEKPEWGVAVWIWGKGLHFQDSPFPWDESLTKTWLVFYVAGGFFTYKGREVLNVECWRSIKRPKPPNGEQS